MVLSEEDHSSSYLDNIKLALKTYFRFRVDAEEWFPDIVISSDSGAKQPKEYIMADERGMIREASLEYGTVPSYHALDPEGREKWKKYLGRRFGKTMKEVGPEDFDRANGFKYPSIAATSLNEGASSMGRERRQAVRRETGDGGERSTSAREGALRQSGFA